MSLPADHDAEVQGEVRLLCGTSDGAGFALRVENGTAWGDANVDLRVVESWCAPPGEDPKDYETQPTEHHAQTKDLEGVLDWLRAATLLVEIGIRRRDAARAAHPDETP